MSRIENLGTSRGRITRPSRVGLFVDEENLYKSLPRSSNRSMSLEYSALLRFAGSFGELVHAGLYVCQGDGRVPFLIKMKHVGFTHIVTRCRRRLVDGRFKSSADVSLAMDAWLAVVNRIIDFLVVATGDSDFVPLIERVVDRGIPVVAVGPNGSTSPDIVIAANRFFDMEEIDGLVRVQHASDTPGIPSRELVHRNGGNPAAVSPRQLAQTAGR